MATKTEEKAPAKKRAPRATKAKAAEAAKTEEQTDAPQAPLFTVGKMPPVRPGTHRDYAQRIARSLAKAKPNGFTLAEFREELVKQADASSITPPKGGWPAHNMPTWMAHEKQKWIVPVGSKEAKEAAKETADA